MIEKYKELPRTDPTLLYAEDLLGKAVTLTIDDINYERVLDFQEKPVDMLTLKFKGKKKRLWLCKTNVRLFWALFGKEDAKAPLGKEITLQAMKVDAFGEVVDAIRIKGAPWLNEDMRVVVPQGKKKVKMTLFRTIGRSSNALPPTANQEPNGEQADAPPPDHWDRVDNEATR